PISTNFIMNLGFGGYFSYLIDAQYKTDLGEGEILQVLDPASLNRLSDMGLSFDIGLERQLGNGKLQIETRIQPGLGKLDFIPGEGTHRNFGVMFSLNYMFALR
ncbi:MAG TPA: hypothetical protein PKC24_09210, partial [Cyclobacteriaceae bacterium]|nr:hypothetical protein [Cyclobacteriaceae bacterium]